MNYQKFATLYATQLLLGKTINQLCVYQYEANTPNFINLLIAEAEQISKQLGDGYFEDSFWLRAPLNVLDAYKIYERQNIKK